MYRSHDYPVTAYVYSSNSIRLLNATVNVAGCRLEFAHLLLTGGCDSTMFAGSSGMVRAQNLLQDHVDGSSRLVVLVEKVLSF